MSPKIVRGFIISTFVTLYAVVSLISTIHVIEFFELSNPTWLAVSLAIAFEIGAAASLAAIIALHKMNKTLIWFLFIVLTGMQMMGNTYYAFTHLVDFQGWVQLFGLVDEDILYQKRVLAILSGAILPLVSLGFIKALVDYIKPTEDELGENRDHKENSKPESTEKSSEIVEDLEKHLAEVKLPETPLESEVTIPVQPIPTEVKQPNIEQHTEIEPVVENIAHVLGEPAEVEQPVLEEPAEVKQPIAEDPFVAEFLKSVTSTDIEIPVKEEAINNTTETLLPEEKKKL